MEIKNFNKKTTSNCYKKVEKPIILNNRERIFQKKPSHYILQTKKKINVSRLYF